MAAQTFRKWRLGLVACAIALGVTACSNQAPKHLEPLSYQVQRQLKNLGMSAGAPLMIRIFKEEAELEVWKLASTGQYALFKVYPICRWSGELGPKLAEGDRQAPEGFYPVKPGQMNPWSNSYLSFNLGYPNKYDSSYNRTGSYLMVHGNCSSAGCYAMTDKIIAEIFSLARESFAAGQEVFQVQAFPFRLTDENMALHVDSPWHPFWQNLKIGYDAFEIDRHPPKVTVCGRQYIFNKNFTVADENRIDAVRPCPPSEEMVRPDYRDLVLPSDNAGSRLRQSIADRSIFTNLIRTQ